MININNNLFFKLINPIIFLSLIIISCSTDNSMTNSTYQDYLNKPNGYDEFFSTTPTNNSNDNWEKAIEGIFNKLAPLYGKNKVFNENCITASAVLVAVGVGSFFKISSPPNLEQPYDFRDNYLTKSHKGLEYIACYYILSTYGIENNLVINNIDSHYPLLLEACEISHNLQYSKNNSSILVDDSTYNNFKNMISLYRKTKNHKYIDTVLNYLENDIDNYHLKTIAEIRTDFQ